MNHGNPKNGDKVYFTSKPEGFPSNFGIVGGVIGGKVFVRAKGVFGEIIFDRESLSDTSGAFGRRPWGFVPAEEKKEEPAKPSVQHETIKILPLSFFNLGEQANGVLRTVLKGKNGRLVRPVIAIDVLQSKIWDFFGKNAEDTFREFVKDNCLEDFFVDLSK